MKNRLVSKVISKSNADEDVWTENDVEDSEKKKDSVNELLDSKNNGSAKYDDKM